MRIRHIVVIFYVLVGVFVGWTHGYISVTLLKNLASAILAIVLWFLVLLGVNLHITA
jgi:hypothetical protein